jgi:predicted regulator of Ras-like GTPase activity (Roadblock/LC7/MglB family)
MTIPFLHFFKRAGAKLARPVERDPASPVQAPLAKPNSERLSKTVMPNMTRSSHRTSESVLAFNARSRGVPLVPEPVIERVISLELGEIAAQIPAGYLKPIESGQAPRLLSLQASEIEKGMATGQPTVSIVSIYRQAPEIFLRNVADSDVSQVALPFAKVLEQFKNLQIRRDQVREPAVPQVETPFLSVTLQDKERFGTPIQPIEASPLPPVRVEPATAETLAAAQPEAKAQKMYGPTAPVKGAISLHAPVPVTAPPQSESVVEGTPKRAMPPTRIPFLPNGADVPATERVPASSGPSVPIRIPPPSGPARIPFNPPISFAQSKLPPPPPPEPIVMSEEPPPAAPDPAPKIEIKKDEAVKISLPLKIVLQNLPEFQLNGDPDDVPDDVEIAFPFSLIEPQLALGRVTVTPPQFEEAMPENYREKFDPNEANTPVVLPLQEVLKNLPTASLRMREDQEQEEIPHAIETPFSLKAAEDAKRLNIDKAPVAEIAPEKKDVEADVTPPSPVEEALDAKTLVARASALPGIAACAVTFADGLSLAGNLPEDVRAEGLCAMAPSILQRIGKHMPETRLGDVQAMTLHCGKSPITFLMEGNICLAALQKGEEISADTRGQLARMLHELAKAFSHPEVAHVDH